MPTVYRKQLDAVRIDANGYRVTVASATFNVFNVTQNTSLGTIASDANGVIAQGSHTANVGDVIELSHATYPLTQRLILAETQELAYLEPENNVAAYIVENLRTSTTNSRLVAFYAQDMDAPDSEPIYLGQGKTDTTTTIPYQSNISKNLRIFKKGIDDTKNQGRFIIEEAASYQDILIPATTGGPLWDHYVDRTTATTSAETLHLGRIEGGTLSENGDKVAFEYSGVFDVTHNTTIFYVLVGGTSVFASDDWVTLTTDDVDWRITGTIVRVSSSVVRVSVELSSPGVYSPTVSVEVTGLSLTGVLEVKLQAENTTAGDAILKFAHAEKIAAAAWTPNNISSAIARYKASTVTALVGGSVSTWKDIILGTYDATNTGSARPTLESEDGQLFVRFDGIEDYLNTSIATAFTDFAIFMVIRPQNLTSGGSTKRFIDKKYDDGFYFGTDVSTSNQMGGGIIETVSPYGDHYPATVGSWYAVLMQRNGTTKTIRFNGVSDDETVSGTALSTANLRIGADQSAANFGQFDIKELVVCSDNLSATELTSLIAYSLREYGLTL